jgi:phage-related protein
MHSFTYHGFDFGGENYGVTVIGAEYERLPQPRLAVDEYAQRDGASFQGSTYGPRRIALECRLVGSTEANRRVQLDNVLGVLNLSQAQGGGDLTIDAIPGKVFTGARLQSAVDSQLSARLESFTLQFVADPWPTAGESTSTGDVAVSGSGTTTVTL